MSDLTLSDCKTAEDILRWHYVHDCVCNLYELGEYITPWGHYDWCPMHNPDDDAWNYVEVY